MTNELEKTFFDTFGIEPKYKTCIFKYCKNKKEYDCENCNDREWHYPRITPEILLELICIAHTSPVITFCSRNVVNLKNEVLNVLCNYIDSRDIKHQVRTLFEEG